VNIIKSYNHDWYLPEWSCSSVAPVHVTDFPVVNVHVDELSSAQIWQHKLCKTLSAYVNINYRPIYNLFLRNKSWKPECVLSFNTGWRIKLTNIRQPMLKLKHILSSINYFDSYMSKSDVLLSLCKQTNDLSIGYNLISTCTGACDWLSRRKCTYWWIVVCSNMAA
jgi:hypothetical protein